MNNDKYNFDDIEPLEDGAPEGLDDIVLCRIMYTPDFKMVFSYLRTLMEKQEYSLRAKYVACMAISLVPAHYTVWSYKFDIVKHLYSSGEYDINQEFKWCNEVALNNEKNYQIWQYRELLIKLVIDAKHGGDKSLYDLESEYEIIGEMLESDAKNYHVWSHKRWVVEYFGLFRDANELEYTKVLIEADVRNNSAWNFRNFVCFGDNRENFDVDTVVREVEFTAKYIRESITNPSSWNYMKFLYSLCKRPTDSKLGRSLLTINSVVADYTCSSGEVEKKISEQCLSVPAFELLGDMLRDEGSLEEMAAVYTLLGEELDPVRGAYWKYKLSM